MSSTDSVCVLPEFFSRGHDKVKNTATSMRLCSVWYCKCIGCYHSGYFLSCTDTGVVADLLHLSHGEINSKSPQLWYKLHCNAATMAGN
eukprot:2412066-Rhodomonas_salina.2